jgi:hypothetical protein
MVTVQQILQQQLTQLSSWQRLTLPMQVSSWILAQVLVSSWQHLNQII